MKTDILLVKIDKRTKAGEVVLSRGTYSSESAQEMIKYFEENCKDEKYKIRTVEWVERINLNGGKKFWEPSDTPMYCSPAFDAYWAM